MKIPPKHNAVKMFQAGMVFQEASEVLFAQTTVGQRLHLGIAYVVLSALAFETYLKCLLIVETGDCPSEHNFKKIILQLPTATRARLKKRHDIEFTPHAFKDEVLQRHGLKGDWDSLVEHCQDAFVLLRYPYEADAEKMKIFGIKTLIQCTREFILDLRPEWIDAPPTSPTP